MAEKKYADGMYIKNVSTKFGIIKKCSFKAEEFIQFINDNKNEKGYVNVDILEGKEKPYAVLNDFKPNGGSGNSSNGGNSNFNNNNSQGQQSDGFQPSNDFNQSDSLPF